MGLTASGEVTVVVKILVKTVSVPATILILDFFCSFFQVLHFPSSETGKRILAQVSGSGQLTVFLSPSLFIQWSDYCSLHPSFTVVPSLEHLESRSKGKSEGRCERLLRTTETFSPSRVSVKDF